MKKVAKVTELINKREYKQILSFIQNNQSMRKTRKNRLLRVISFLYHTGIRINETKQINNKMMNELLNTGTLIIASHKQGSEKTIYITKSAIKELSSIFGSLEDNNSKLFVSERNKRTPLEPTAMIRDINSLLKTIFGADTRKTSHSFRKSLISEMAIKGINTKIIQNLIGHKSITTTYNYIRTSDTDIMNALEVVR